MLQYVLRKWLIQGIWLYVMTSVVIYNICVAYKNKIKQELHLFCLIADMDLPVAVQYFYTEGMEFDWFYQHIAAALDSHVYMIYR